MHDNLKYLFICVILLAGCDASVRLSFSELQSQLQQNNRLLDGDDLNSVEEVFPFDDQYLKNRHDLYQSVDLEQLSDAQKNELAYLQIQERYPERFLPWPSQVNLVAHLASDELKLKNWSRFLITRMEQAKDSNILLSRYEKALLSQYIQPKAAVLNELTHYLAKYRPRTQLGLYQLPNGREWYQSKLNYYYGSVIAPDTLLNQVQHTLSNLERIGPIELTNTGHTHFSLQYLKAHCKLVEGLNWQDLYINLPATAKGCVKVELASTQQLLLTLMEIDLGLHYQAWSEKQAKITLKKRLSLHDKDTESLIKSVVLYPASIFALSYVI